MSELYNTDLQTLLKVMEYLDEVTSNTGVFSIEIRVRTDDVDEWAVIGWGEAGDPCVLRFEQDKPVPVKPTSPGFIQWQPSTINPNTFGQEQRLA